ncbi:hypothetical protein [Rathayibacter soli]|uniref:hypothetical protein n=1 Tax=Rathayibacter soli TaxID=3144168 RepID=UPI0027E3BB83|nr:hypothetical protein [Glaciibacter superstes]
MGAPLNDRQRAVLNWIAAGRRAGDEPIPTYKHSATALASRGLIDLDNRYGTSWRARLTSRGRYWLEHGEYPPVGMVLEPLIEVDEEAASPGEAVSDAEFVNWRRVLRSDWNSGGQALSYLEVAEEWALHAAYQPTKDISEQQALADFRDMQRLRPENAAEADAACEHYGRAREQVQHDAVRAQQARESGVAPRKRRGKERNLTVRALARPEPDLHALARVLIQVAIDKAKADEQPEDDADDQNARSAAPRLSSRASEMLRNLPEMRGESMLAPEPRSRTTSPPANPPRARPVPPDVQAKLEEARACHRAGTYLAAVLVARAALADALDGVGAPRDDDLTQRLDRLAQEGRLSRDLVARAAASRPMSIVPSRPEVTATESATLLDITIDVVTELYQGSTAR